MAVSKRTFRNNTGRLILPYCTLVWGGTNLSKWGPLGEPAWESVSFDLEFDNMTPRLKVAFRGDAYGYEAFKAVTGEGVDDLITVKLGYENGTETQEYEFYYTGMTMDSGRSQGISAEGQSITEADINSVRAHVVLNSNEEEKTLEEIVNIGREKFKVGKDVEIEIPDEWKEKKVKQVVIMGSTFSRFLTKLASDHACTVQILAKGKRMVIRENPVKELEKRGVTPGPGDSIGPTAHGFLLGPGLIETITRTTTFRTTPSTPLVMDNHISSESLSLQEKDDDKDAVPRPDVPPKREKVAEEIRNLVKKKANMGSPIKPAVPEMTTNDSDSTPGKDKVIAESVSECKASGDIFMVPQVVGIKPGDVFFIPSLKGDYVEDWFITKVGYVASKGGVKISIEGVRFASAEQNVVSKEDLAKFTSMSAGMNTPEKWNRYYWRS